MYRTNFLDCFARGGPDRAGLWGHPRRQLTGRLGGAEAEEEDASCPAAPGFGAKFAGFQSKSSALSVTTHEPF